MISEKYSKTQKNGFFLNQGKNESFLYFLGLKFDFKLESGVKKELNKV